MSIQLKKKINNSSFTSTSTIHESSIPNDSYSFIETQEHKILLLKIIELQKILASSQIENKQLKEKSIELQSQLVDKMEKMKNFLNLIPGFNSNQSRYEEEGEIRYGQNQGCSQFTEKSYQCHARNISSIPTTLLRQKQFYSASNSLQKQNYQRIPLVPRFERTSINTNMTNCYSKTKRKQYLKANNLHLQEHHGYSHQFNEQSMLDSKRCNQTLFKTIDQIWNETDNSSKIQKTAKIVRLPRKTFL